MTRQCFNSRTREGCDRRNGWYATMSRRFQFTHPGGVRRAFRRLQVQAHQVSIHAPGRGATWTFRAIIPVWSAVSIHAPGRGATAVCFWQVWSMLVSIHAPGRGATPPRWKPVGAHQVSIHAPGRGATRPQGLQYQEYQGFNSRTREGCDTVHE